MLEMAMIHRPGQLGERPNLGRILETMLYYDRVHLMMSAQMFTGLWGLLGGDDLAALLGHYSVTTTLTPEMLAIHNDISPTIIKHRPIAIKLSGREGHILKEKDNAGALLQMIQRLPNGADANWAQVNKLLKATKISRYGKILGGDLESRVRFLSLIKDEETLKMFLRGWARANNFSINNEALNECRIEIIELGHDFMVASSIDVSKIVSGWNANDSWGNVLASAQDYAVDLYLSTAFSADIITAPEISEIASARVDLSLRRAGKIGEQISSFEEMAFDDAHCFSDAINEGLISFSEALKVIDQSRRFRDWAKGLAPDANLIHEYHRAISKDTILKKLPFSLARFSIFNGLAMAADSQIPGAGLFFSAFDTFVLERIIGGWRPNIFVQNVQKTLALADRRALEAGQ